ncbi:MAG: DEAD/DEAH box helicase [Roseivirga sp.]
MSIKDQTAILKKLGIASLNPMQEEAQKVISSQPEVMLLSPTGTGKTLAFLLPLIQTLDPNLAEVQLLIVVPSRELAIQIEQVTREMGSGFKTNAVYGGRAGSKDKIDIKHRPAILIGTPGRMADHIRRENFSTEYIHTLVLDEFDKSLEIGFEVEMEEILFALPNLEKKVLTSATQGVEIPDFVGLRKPEVIDFLDGANTQLKIRSIISPTKDKLQTLLRAICHLGEAPGIIFCNFKDSIERVSDFLNQNGIDHGRFYGGMEQQDRERVLIKFRNGTHRLLLATDLAARGIDVPEIKFIIHYHLPMRDHEFVHRNGRTARMNQDGVAYILQWEGEELPDFIDQPEIEALKEAPVPESTSWQTLYISGGRKDKISKGDIAGLFFRQGDLKHDELGVIELKQDCAFVAVKAAKADHLINILNNSKLKKRKVRVSTI